MSRHRNIELLYASTRNAHSLIPTKVSVPVPHGPPCDVIAFDFVSQLLQLLQNCKIMIQENLLIDIKDPLTVLANTNCVLSSVMSGSIYQLAYNRLITNPMRELFVPIIQWIDRTSVTGNNRFLLKPYMFTPAIFTESLQRQKDAWVYHGFLPKLKSSSAQNQSIRPGDNMRNYHAQLNAVLHSFNTSHLKLKNVWLPLGPTKQMQVDIIIL